MLITVAVSFEEQAAVRLLNWLAQENARIVKRRPDLPLLYDSGVVYRREPEERWCDVLVLYTQGHEDCDGLSAARTGELLARGAAALRPGDPGFEDANRLNLRRIRAECFIQTRGVEGQPALYHCLTRYWVGEREYRDDPSARLGMNGGQIDPRVKRRWERAGVVPIRPQP